MLDNGTKIEGTFSGSWSKKIEIVKGVLEDPGHLVASVNESIDSAMSELQYVNSLFSLVIIVCVHAASVLMLFLCQCFLCCYGYCFCVAISVTY